MGSQRTQGHQVKSVAWNIEVCCINFYDACRTRQRMVQVLRGQQQALHQFAGFAA
jgi:hypothetical protein